jgi:flagellin
MVQISFPSGASLPVRESTAAGAARIVGAIQGSSSGRAFSGHGNGGATVHSDRQHVVAAGRFAAEAKARSVAASNAVEASSLLQSADDALARIRAKLDQLIALAQRAASAHLSDFERAQLDALFQALKSEIDAIAATTEFSGVPLLQGGEEAGEDLEVSFKVGTGAAEQDEITVSIAPASAADLSAGLADDSLRSEAGAAEAEMDAAEAVEAVDAIRAGIAGDQQRFAAAYRTSRTMEQANESVRQALTSPSVAIDLSRVLAERIAEEGGVALTGRAIDRFRQLLMTFDQQDAAPKGPDEKPVGGGTAPKPRASFDLEVSEEV